MLNRRKFLKTGAAATAAVPLVAKAAGSVEHKPELKPGTGISPWSGMQYKTVSTVCTLCQSRCAMLAYIDDGRLAKLEGNPQSARTEGRLCARGQAGVEQPYDPDRILTPMKRAGDRGSGKWQRVSWDEALGELTAKLNALREAGTPERFMVVHGVLSHGTEKLLRDLFLPAYGSASVAGPESLGSTARRTAHQLTWGGAADYWDLAKARYVLNFGSNFLETHTNHVALARRFSRNAVDNRAKLVTFDVRLSNTAARSDEWLPVRPGTDLAVVLAMCNVIMSEGLYKGAGERFLRFCKVTPAADTSLEDKVAVLKEHLKSYTPEWAAKVSGVAADRIKAVAIAFATTQPACVISYRGASAHYNGVDTERAIQMLAAITGNINNPGGRCQGVEPNWTVPKFADAKPPAKRMAILDGSPGTIALPLDGAGQHALRAAKASGGPGVLMWIGHNPVYAYGDTNETTALLKDTSLFPLTVAVTPFFDETAALADIILPDTTALESFDIEAPASADQIAEFAIRQPVVEPRGEARDVKDMLCDLAKRIGVALPVVSGAKFVEESCRQTPDIKTKARGFAGMKKTGIWSDSAAVPAYARHEAAVPPEELQKEGVMLDAATGVYWNWKAAGLPTEAEAVAAGYAATQNAARFYVAQKVGDMAVVGFRPDKVNKSGLFELYSDVLKGLGQTALPVYSEIPEHKVLEDGDLVLTTFKVNVQTGGRTQNARWLDEIHHDNPVWINPATAKARGIKDGDNVIITSKLGELEVRARVTHAVAPWVVALAAHCGRSEYGRFASGKRSPTGVDDTKLDRAKWWTRGGVHANGIIPKSTDPVSGQQRWMDTVVTVRLKEVKPA